MSNNSTTATDTGTNITVTTASTKSIDRQSPSVNVSSSSGWVPQKRIVTGETGNIECHCKAKKLCHKSPNYTCDTDISVDYNVSLPVEETSKQTSHNKNCYLPLTLQDLPDNLLLKIFSYFTVHQLLHKTSLVCWKWRNLSLDSDLWRNINVQGQVKVNDEVLQRITSYSKNVSQLNITDSALVSNDGLISVLQRCYNLQVCKLIRCHQLTNLSLSCIGQSLHKLQKLYLDSVYALSDSSLIEIGVGCPWLIQLSISQCSKITDTGITAVARGCKRMTYLAIDQLTLVTNESLFELSDNCSGLETVCAMGCKFTDIGISYLSKLTKLKTLQLPNVKTITARSIKKLAECCSKLESLNLCLCDGIDDTAIEEISKRTSSLKSVSLVSCNVSDKSLLSLASNCRHIEHVDVGWCNKITDFGVIEISRRAAALRYLGLMKCTTITMATVSELMDCYPRITYSTLWLEYQSLIARARQDGILPDS